jgi:hypothetical protein
LKKLKPRDHINKTLDTLLHFSTGLKGADKENVEDTADMKSL